jgi:predicted nucleotidyltransferase
MMNVDQIKEQIRAFYAGREDAMAVYLYGSAAQNRLTPHSDIDIGVLYKEDAQPDFQQQMSDAAALSTQLNREADLVTLNHASPILRMQVLKKGELLINNAPHQVNLFFIKTINDYFDLKQTRRPIEEHLREVTIYG